MRQLAVGVLVLLSALTIGTFPAQASTITVIGQFSWDDPGLGTGPLFTFENLSGAPLANLFVDLDTDQGPASYALLYPTGIDANGDGLEDTASLIPAGAAVQLANDLSVFTILHAFLRAQDAVLYLLDPSALEPTPLLDSTGAPLGLDGVTLLSAQVGLLVPEPPPNPVPEPPTVALLATALAGVLLRPRLRLRR